jgi:hypothetical protein
MYVVKHLTRHLASLVTNLVVLVKCLSIFTCFQKCSHEGVYNVHQTNQYRLCYKVYSTSRQEETLGDPCFWNRPLNVESGSARHKTIHAQKSVETFHWQR